jgi:hypothetical protein
MSFNDRMKTVDEAFVQASIDARDKVTWHPTWRIDRFQDFTGAVDRLIKSRGLQIPGFAPIGVPLSELRRRHLGFQVYRGNLLLNVGINAIWGLITNLNSQTAYSNANAYIGVGDSTTAASATQTGLQAPSNVLFVGMATGYPTAGTGQAAVWQSSFGSSQGNWVWNEIGVANGNNPPTTGILMNRLVQSMGTKASGATWVPTLTISLS